MMRSPINIRFTWWLVFRTLEDWIVSWNRINIHITTVLWCVNHSNQTSRGRQADKFFTPDVTFVLSLHSVKRHAMIVVWVIGRVLPLFQWSQSSYNYLSRYTDLVTKVVELPLSVSWRYEVGGEVQLHSFLTSALDGGDWSNSHVSCFHPTALKNPSAHWIGGWVGARGGLDGLGEEKISWPC